VYGRLVTTTIVSDRKGSAVTEIRTYENYSIRWERGSTWSGYQSRAEAQACVDFAALRGSVGTVEVTSFSVEVKPEHAHLYRPGV
jgi:uncharacterized protein CbrC (UPF0167 family)